MYLDSFKKNQHSFLKNSFNNKDMESFIHISYVCQNHITQGIFKDKTLDDFQINLPNNVDYNHWWKIWDISLYT